MKAYLLAGLSTVILSYMVAITPGENLILFFILASQYERERPLDKMGRKL